MQDELVNRETAILLKEKGFDLEVQTYISEGQTGVQYGDLENWNTHGWNGEFISLPTQSLAQKWLREVHKLEINIISDMMGYGLTLVNRKTLTSIKLTSNNIFRTYEEALEAGLQKGLRLEEW